jgi:type VI secretion system protein ImpK
MNREHDNFERTVVLPRPGGRASSQIGTNSPATGGRSFDMPLHPDFRLEAAGINPIVKSAARLLSLITTLRHTLSHDDIPSLRRGLIDEVNLFESGARSRGIPSDSIMLARYLLCSVIDEAILSTPWGSGGEWAEQTLLSTFHNESQGGDRFFKILDDLLSSPQVNLDLLELIYICLSLGFRGRYLILDNGEYALENLRSNLFEQIQNQRGSPDVELSENWRPKTDYGEKISRILPIWVALAIGGALSILLFIGLSLGLEQSVQPMIDALNQIDSFQ